MLASIIMSLFVVFCLLGHMWFLHMDNKKAESYTKKAQHYMDLGDWQSAAANYKKVIMIRLDDLAALQEPVRQLSEIYSQQGIHADLSKILECPNLLRDISALPSKEEEGRLTHDLRGQITALLSQYPGEIES